MNEVLKNANRDQLLERRVVVLDSEITTHFAQELIAKLLYLEYENRSDAIHLMVDSPGGGVVDGFAILDTLDQISPPTFTYCYGRADAFAAVIVAHGFKSRRYACNSSAFSISKPWTTESTATDAAELSRIAFMLAETIAADTGNSIEKVQCDLADATSFDANAAQKYNLVDSVVNEYPEVQLGM